MLKLNTLHDSVFEAAEVSGATIKSNSGKELNRRAIVSAGRVVASEYMGRLLNSRGKGEKYESRLNAKGIDYGTFAKNHAEQLVEFCAANADRMRGKDEAPTYAEVMADPTYFRNETFLATLASITREVIRPIIPEMIADVGADLMQLTTIPVGGTLQLDVTSNDVFLYEDTAPGDGRSSRYQYLYGKTFTLRAESYTAQTRINWYQMVANGDIGSYYAAFAEGYWAKMYGLFHDTLTAAAANTQFVPSGLVYSGYTSANLINAQKKVAALNRVARTDLVAYGDIAVLNKILPVDGTGAAIVGLQYGLGERWFNQGFLPNAFGMQLIEARPTVVPGTQNSSIDLVDFGTTLYIFPKATAGGFAPVQGVVEAGSPFDVTMTPDRTADFVIDINTEARMGFAPLFARKGAVINNIT